ncbi:MAG: hypothetical protein ACI4EA_12300 [Candidatus Ornithomonoglobus sp.]
MGIFGGGYMKEGPGIDKNAPKKKGVFLYIDIVFRKFMDLMGTGFMCFIISLPFLAFTYVVLASFIMNGLGISAAIESTAQSMAGEGADAEEVAQVLYFSMRSMITIIVYNFFGSGPVSASYAFITRCFTRGEHVWKMSDGWDKFKENLKQTIALLILDIVVISLASNAISFYSALAAANTGAMATLLTAAQCFTAVILVLYMMMHIYIYQIMVTYECSFIDLIKSSITIAIAKLPMSVLLTAVTGAVIFALLGMITNPRIGIIIYAVLGHIVLRYPLEFYASRVIEKNIKAVKKQEKKNRAKITYLDAE